MDVAIGKEGEVVAERVPRSHRWEWVGLACLVAIMVVHAVHLACVAEDALISFRFARNLAGGHGLVWNIGEPPVEGYTNFLWVILLAIAMKLDLEPGLVAQVLGTAATAWLMLEVYRLSRTVHGDGAGLLGLVAPALLAVSGPVATWATSGMETNLFTCFVTAAVVHYVAGLRRQRLGMAVPFLLLLAGLTRPEGVLVFLLFWGHTVYRLGKEQERTDERRRFLAWTAVFAGPGLAYFLWRYSLFGFLLPNTFYAKGGGGVHQAERGVSYLILFARVYLLPAALLLPAWAVVRLWGRWGTERQPEREARVTGDARGEVSRATGASWSLPVGLVVVPYLLYVVYVGGDYMAMFRFLVPVLPLLYFVVQEALRAISRGAGRGGRVFLWAWLVCMLAYTAFPSLTRAQMRALGVPAWAVDLYRKPAWMHGYADGVNLERWHAARLTLLGKFFGRYARSPQDSVLTNAIGAISYYSGIRVYGEHGLVDTHIAHLDIPGLGRGLPGHEKGDYAYSLLKRPTFIMVNRDLTLRPIPRFALLRGRPAWLLSYFDGYVAVSVFMRDRRNNAHGYFNFLVLKGHVRRLEERVFDPGS